MTSRSLRRFYNEILQEPVPDEFMAILSGLSDEGAGSGGLASGRLTQPESDIRHSDRASREIHAVQATSHNRCGTLNASDEGKVP